MRIVLLGLATLILVAGCAKKGRPGGGPEDKAGPFVVLWSPVAGTDSVPSDRSVELGWSEPVQHATVEANLIVSPDSAVLELAWQGGTLSLMPRGGWLPGIPHWVWIRLGVLDRHGIPAEGVFGVWFSTADSVHSTLVEGTATLTGGSPAAGAMVQFTQPESTLLWTCLTDASGAFSAAGLAPGMWQLSAYTDLNRDGRYDRGTEPWGVADIELIADSVMTPALRLALEDTAPPIIRDLTAAHSRQVRVGFSEPLSAVPENAFAVSDTAGVSYGIGLASLSAADPAGVRLLLDRSLHDDLVLLTAAGVRDSAGLALAETTMTFLGTSAADTVAPAVYRLGYDPTTRSRLWIMFSEPMMNTAVESLMVLEVPGLRALPGRALWGDPQVLTWTGDRSQAVDSHLLVVLSGARDAQGIPMRRPLVGLVPTPADTMLPSWDVRYPSTWP